MTKDRFLTVRWNNILSAILGLIPLAYAGIVISTSALSPSGAFYGLVAIGVVY